MPFVQSPPIPADTIRVTPSPFSLMMITAGVLCTVIFFPFLTGRLLYIYLDIGSDTYNQFYPFLAHMSSYLRTEGIPRWSFAVGMGQNVFPGGVQDPFSLLPMLAGKQALPYLFVYMEILKILLTTACAYRILQHRGSSEYTAALGGIVLAFSGYMILGSGWYGHSTTVLYGTLLILAVERLVIRSDPRLVALAMFMVTTRSAFYTWLYGLFATSYLLMRLLETGARRAAIATAVRQWFLNATLGTGACALFLIPDLTRLVESPRFSASATSLSQSGALSAPWFSLPQTALSLARLLGNNLTGTGLGHSGWGNYLEAPALFIGTSLLLVVPFAFSSKMGRRIIAARGLWLGSWLVVLLIPVVRRLIHLNAGDYFKGGVSFFVTAALWIMAIEGLNRIQNGARAHPAVLAAGALTIVLILFGVSTLDTAIVIDGDLRAVSLVITLCTVLILAFWNRPLVSAQFCRISFAILLILDITANAYITINKRECLSTQALNSATGYNDGTREVLLSCKDSSFFRVSKDYSSGLALHASMNDAQIQGYYGTPSYSSLNQKSYLAFLAAMGIIDPALEYQTRWAPGLRGHPLLETLCSVKYALSKEKSPDYLHRGYQPIGTSGPITIMRNRFSLPLGYTYHNWIPREALLGTSQLYCEIALLKSCVLDDGPQQIGILQGKLPGAPIYTLDSLAADRDRLLTDTLTIAHHSNNRIDGSIDARSEELLFLSIPYDRGWMARVDEKPVPLLRAQFGFMAVELKPGHHSVNLRYRLPFAMTGLLISTVAAAIIIFGAFHCTRQRRERGASLMEISGDTTAPAA